MSKIVDDVKSGLKGIRGAGDAIRGSAMEVTDQAFDNNSNHPQTQLAQAKNHNIAEKGKQDIAGTDHMVARHEQKHGKHTAGTAAAPTTTGGCCGHDGNDGGDGGWGCYDRDRCWGNYGDWNHGGELTGHLREQVHQRTRQELG
ncbi:hypothetical protein PG993_011979 [Apiospora rasikravindrae]|uniref:Uncharacterized protein n=1 Tax=Apiospora rasikravindrae TaxID=990691 RepID=A0ABR1S190_9PEZI